MRLFSITLLALLVCSGLAICAESPDAPATGHPDVIIVRRFAAPRRTVVLDPSLGLSLHGGQQGVPPARRGESVARATAFIVADTITQQLHDRGFDTVQSDEADPEPGGRALIIFGVFRRINEGHRRHLAAKDASATAVAEIKIQSYGATPRRLTVIQLDSRQMPHQGGTQRETGLRSAGDAPCRHDR